MEDVFEDGFEIVDPHVHYWSTATHEWLKGALDPDAPKPLRRFLPCAKPFFPADHRAAFEPKLTLLASVYVQANLHTSPHVACASEEASFCEGMRVASGLPSVFVTYAPLHRPDEASAVLRACARYEGFRGVRFMLDFDPDQPRLNQTDSGEYMSRNDAFQLGTKLVEELGLVFELQVCQCQLAEAADFASRFPRLQFVLNHAGFPLRGGEQQWRAGIEALAKHDRVCVKIGGLGCYDHAEQPWSQAEIDAAVAVVLDAFGVDRSMFASNLPVDLIDHDNPVERYAVYVAATRAWLRARDAPAQDDALVFRKLFRDNAIKVYDIKL